LSADRVIEHLHALIRISSVSSQSNRPVIEYAKRVLAQAQWHSREHIYLDASGIEKVNLMAAPLSENLSTQDVALAFMCHTDTVPYAADWPDALLPRTTDGKVFGCGACDVKGFLASLLTAVEGCAPTVSVRVVLTADEEIGCVGATRLLAADILRPRQLVVGEPTSLHPARAGKGYALAEFTVHGTEAHSALPANGVSAIYGAARLIAAIEAYAASLAGQQNPIFAPAFTTINVGTIDGGTAKNIIAGSCRFLLEWRPIPEQDPDEVFDAVVRIAEQMSADSGAFRYTAKLLRQQTGFETEANASLVRAVSEVTGNAPTSIAFGSEASILAAAVQEVIVFGPGDMQTAHSDRECVPVAELLLAVECLKTLMTGIS
jgi:acetylornithine deacetylase